MSNPIYQEYLRALVNEAAMQSFGIPPELGVLADEGEITNLLSQIFQFIRQSAVPRSYLARYGLTQEPMAYESVAAHTGLCQMLADRILSYIYGPNFTKTDDGFTPREIMEAIRIHDLPENEFGDQCDNGDIDEAKKARDEATYFDKFIKMYPLHDSVFASNAYRLFKHMCLNSHYPTGQLLYLIDKASALLMTLWYDSIGYPPMLHKDAANLSNRDRAEMELCERCEDGYYYASEMWAVDFFHIRKFAGYDHTGIITAIIVMMTLQVNGKWYSWREEDYRQAGIEVDAD